MKIKPSLFYSLNICLNGYKAIIYCFGLSEPRFVQYSIVLNFLGKYTDEIILDLGSGHSILPTFLSKKAKVIVLDFDENAVRWQRKINRNLIPINASITNLPFKSECLKILTCISTIEHLPNNLDIKGMREIGRVLKIGGIQIQVIPISKKSEDKMKWIPFIYRKILGKYIINIYNKFKIDNYSASYYERQYTKNDINKRIIKPSKCKLIKTANYDSNNIITFFHEKLIPYGFFSFFEYISSRLAKINNEYKIHSSILKLMK